MRNLKKILALVLALVMSLSLMATAGAADASAAGTDKYKTAKEVLEGLEVFRGDEGGMRYDASITRAETAALVYRIATADVKDTQVGLYTNHPFTDLDPVKAWAIGYIAYGYNAEILKGNGDNTFSPNDPVTGYATLAMILRTMGYGRNHEFEGVNWEIQTAATARQEGLLKGVTAADEATLGQPASRGLVAQILFNALLQPTVKFNINTPYNYVKDAETLGYQKFTLEEVEGVVVANEYAGILRGENVSTGKNPTAAGQTVLLNKDNKAYEVNAASGLEDLGEIRVAYTTELAKRDNYNLKCLALIDPDSDNVAYDDGEEKGNLNGFGVTIRDTETERYLNFGESTGADKTNIKISYSAYAITDTVAGLDQDDAITVFCSNYHLNKANVVANNRLTVKATYTGSGSYRITYVPGASSDLLASSVGDDHYYSVQKDAEGNYFYRVEMKPGITYGGVDERVIKHIFNFAGLDRITLKEFIDDTNNTIAIDTVSVWRGEVYRGTQFVTDYSDTKSYEEFYKDCITAATENINEIVNGNQRGWWLKVIDNDKDGVADWVFQTRYTVAKVAKVAEDGTLTLDTTISDITNKKIVADTPLAKDSLSGWPGSNHKDAYNDSVNKKALNADGTATAKNESGETLSAGDVVYYAQIDGKNYAWKSEVVSARVSSINRQALTVTVDGNETPYHESAVHEHSVSTDILSGVVNMSGTVNMNLYLDKYSNLAAFSQDISGNFVLLTNGWAQSLKNGNEYAAMVWEKDATALKQYDVSVGGSLFISNRIDDGMNSWNRIKHFNPLNCNTTDSDDIHTMVAYMESDGENVKLMPVDTIYDVERQNGRQKAMIDLGTTIPGSALVVDKTLTGGKADQVRIYETSALSVPQPYNVAKNATRVRALSTTMYYYVYQSYQNNNGNANGLNVKQFQGYAAGAGWLSAAEQAKYVEDVYVVGTRGQDVNGDYYTADVVVIELNDSFIHGHVDSEEVFIYNLPVTTTWSTIEEVEVIRANGAKETLKIDLTESRNYTEADNTANSSGIGWSADAQPGLFYLHRTSRTDSENIWAIERMSHKDIRLSGHYDVGDIVTSYNTLSYNYAQVRDYICGDGSVNGMDYTHTASNMRPDSDSYRNAARKNTENSKYYTLSYNNSDWSARGTFGTADESTPEHVLRQWYNPGSTSDLNHNQVLVRFDSAGNIIYAVSFEHVYDNNSENYAQKVWRSVTLDHTKDYTVVENADVLFYGVDTFVGFDPSGDPSFGVGGDDESFGGFDPDTGFSSATGAINRITVSYAVAKAYDDAHVTDGVKNVAIKGTDVKYTLVNSANQIITVDDVVPNVNGATYYLYITQGDVTYTWILVQEKANDDNVLTYANGNAVPNPIPVEADDENGNIISFILKHKVPAGAKATWTVTDKISKVNYTVEVSADGKFTSNIPNSGSSLNEFVQDFKVVVVAENGDKNYYGLVDPDAAAEAARQEVADKLAAIRNKLDASDLSEEEKAEIQDKINAINPDEITADNYEAKKAELLGVIEEIDAEIPDVEETEITVYFAIDAWSWDGETEYTVAPITVNSRTFTLTGEELVEEGDFELAFLGFYDGEGYTAVEGEDGWTITVDEGLEEVTLIVDYDYDKTFPGDTDPDEPENPDEPTDNPYYDEENGDILLDDNNVFKPSEEDPTQGVVVTPDGTKYYDSTIDEDGNVTLGDYVVKPGDTDTDLEDWPDEESQTLSSRATGKAKKLTVTTKPGRVIDFELVTVIRCTAEQVGDPVKNEDGSTTYTFKLTPSREGVTCTVQIVTKAAEPVTEDITVQVVDADGEAMENWADYIEIVVNDGEPETELPTVTTGDTVTVTALDVEGMIVTAEPTYIEVAEDTTEVVITVTVEEVPEGSVPVKFVLEGDGVESGATVADYVTATLNGEEVEIADLKTAEVDNEIIVTAQEIEGKIITVDPESITVAEGDTEAVFTVTVENETENEYATVTIVSEVEGAVIVKQGDLEITTTGEVAIDSFVDIVVGEVEGKKISYTINDTTDEHEQNTENFPITKDLTITVILTDKTGDEGLDEAKTAAKAALANFAKAWSIAETDEIYGKVTGIIEAQTTVEAVNALMNSDKTSLNVEAEALAELKAYIEPARKEGAIVIANALLKDIVDANSNVKVAELDAYKAVVDFMNKTETTAQAIEDMFYYEDGNIAFNPNVQLIAALTEAVKAAAKDQLAAYAEILKAQCGEDTARQDNIDEALKDAVAEVEKAANGVKVGEATTAGLDLLNKAKNAPVSDESRKTAAITKVSEYAKAVIDTLDKDKDAETIEKINGYVAEAEKNIKAKTTNGETLQKEIDAVVGSTKTKIDNEAGRDIETVVTNAYRELTEYADKIKANTNLDAGSVAYLTGALKAAENDLLDAKKNNVSTDKIPAIVEAAKKDLDGATALQALKNDLQTKLNMLNLAKQGDSKIDDLAKAKIKTKINEEIAKLVNISTEAEAQQVHDDCVTAVEKLAVGDSTVVDPKGNIKEDRRFEMDEKGNFVAPTVDELQKELDKNYGENTYSLTGEGDTFVNGVATYHAFYSVTKKNCTIELTNIYYVTIDGKNVAEFKWAGGNIPVGTEYDGYYVTGDVLIDKAGVPVADGKVTVAAGTSKVAQKDCVLYSGTKVTEIKSFTGDAIVVVATEENSKPESITAKHKDVVAKDNVVRKGAYLWIGDKTLMMNNGAKTYYDLIIEVDGMESTLSKSVTVETTDAQGKALESFPIPVSGKEISIVLNQTTSKIPVKIGTQLIGYVTDVSANTEIQTAYADAAEYVAITKTTATATENFVENEKGTLTIPKALAAGVEEINLVPAAKLTFETELKDKKLSVTYGGKTEEVTIAESTPVYVADGAVVKMTAEDDNAITVNKTTLPEAGLTVEAGKTYAFDTSTAVSSVTINAEGLKGAVNVIRTLKSDADVITGPSEQATDFTFVKRVLVNGTDKGTMLAGVASDLVIGNVVEIVYTLTPTAGHHFDADKIDDATNSVPAVTISADKKSGVAKKVVLNDDGTVTVTITVTVGEPETHGTVGEANLVDHGPKTTEGAGGQANDAYTKLTSDQFGEYSVDASTISPEGVITVKINHTNLPEYYNEPGVPGYWTGFQVRLDDGWDIEKVTYKNGKELTEKETDILAADGTATGEGFAIYYDAVSGESGTTNANAKFSFIPANGDTVVVTFKKETPSGGQALTEGDASGEETVTVTYKIIFDVTPGSSIESRKTADNTGDESSKEAGNSASDLMSTIINF